MKKKTALFFVFGAICVCGLIGCGGDDKENGVPQNDGKQENGEICQKNDECSSGFCQKGAENNLCAVKIANDKACMNKSDLCADEGYACKGDPLKCTKVEVDDEKENEKEKEEESKKAKEGEPCTTNEDCESDLKCDEKGGDGGDKDELVCQKKAQYIISDPVKAVAACDHRVDCGIPNGSKEVCHAGDNRPSDTPYEFTDCSYATLAYSECILATDCEEILSDRIGLALQSCRNEYKAARVACDGWKVENEACDISSFGRTCVPLFYACHRTSPESNVGVCETPVGGDNCSPVLGCRGGDEGDFLCIVPEGSSHGKCKIKTGRPCSGRSDVNCEAGIGYCVKESQESEQYRCTDE